MTRTQREVDLVVLAIRSFFLTRRLVEAAPKGATKTTLFAIILN
jgi:hypothetical protein